MDPERRGEYQGVQEVSRALGSMWAPALYTFLAMSWGAEGWLVIAGIVLTATIAMGPSLRLAERFRARHYPVEPEGQPDPGVDPGTRVDTGLELAPLDPPRHAGS